MFRPQFAHHPLTNLLIVIWMSALTWWCYSTFVAKVEQRDPFELSLKGMGRELGLGLFFGFGLYTVCTLVLMLAGVYKVEGFNSWEMLLPALWFGVSSGFFEELLFRGIIFRISEEVFGTWASVIISSLGFGLIHLNNPGSTYEGVIFIAVEFGILTAACFMLTRRLWLGMGLHMAWNYTQSAIFSGIGSGNGSSQGLIQAKIQGPDLLTGGVFGMESSIVAFILCTSLGLFMLFKAVKKGNIHKPFWLRNR